MSSPDEDNNGQRGVVAHHQAHHHHPNNGWTDTWREFNRALRSPEDFNAIHWVLRLGRAAVKYVYITSRLYKLGLHKKWRPLVPMFAVGLISFILWSYFAVLRDIIKKRWCCTTMMIPTDSTSAIEPSGMLEEAVVQCRENCQWMIFHDTIVAYLGFMILYSFLSGCFRSPGVALPAVDGNHRPPSSKVSEQDVQETTQQHQRKWKSIDGQGGCFGLNVSLDVVAEERRVTECNDLAQRAIARCNGVIGETFPSPNPTFCGKCKITRPSRCHHCNACNRCILQYDHHCSFLNNCVGYNNYRYFILTLFFLTLGCWYGAIVLFVPFYQHLQKQITEKGFAAIFSYKTGVLEIPPPWVLVQELLSSSVNHDILVIKIIYPILFAIGLMQAGFLSYHIRYIFSARTTLEHMIVLDWQYRELVQNRNTNYKPPRNPFDDGWYNNIVQILGSNLLLVFLPIPLEPLLSSPTKKGN